MQQFCHLHQHTAAPAAVIPSQESSVEKFPVLASLCTDGSLSVTTGGASTTDNVDFKSHASACETFRSSATASVTATAAAQQQVLLAVLATELRDAVDRWCPVGLQRRRTSPLTRNGHGDVSASAVYSIIPSEHVAVGCYDGPAAFQRARRHGGKEYWLPLEEQHESYLSTSVLEEGEEGGAASEHSQNIALKHPRSQDCCTTSSRSSSSGSNSSRPSVESLLATSGRYPYCTVTCEEGGKTVEETKGDFFCTFPRQLVAVGSKLESLSSNYGSHLGKSGEQQQQPRCLYTCAGAAVRIIPKATVCLPTHLYREEAAIEKEDAAGLLGCLDEDITSLDIEEVVDAENCGEAVLPLSADGESSACNVIRILRSEGSQSPESESDAVFYKKDQYDSAQSKPERGETNSHTRVRGNSSSRTSSSRSNRSSSSSSNRSSSNKEDGGCRWGEWPLRVSSAEDLNNVGNSSEETCVSRKENSTATGAAEGGASGAASSMESFEDVEGDGDSEDVFGGRKCITNDTSYTKTAYVSKTRSASGDPEKKDTSRNDPPSDGSESCPITAARSHETDSSSSRWETSDTLFNNPPLLEPSPPVAASAQKHYINDASTIAGGLSQTKKICKPGDLSRRRCCYPPALAPLPTLSTTAVPEHAFANLARREIITSDDGGLTRNVVVECPSTAIASGRSSTAVGVAVSGEDIGPATASGGDRPCRVVPVEPSIQEGDRHSDTDTRRQVSCKSTEATTVDIATVNTDRQKQHLQRCLIQRQGVIAKDNKSIDQVNIADTDASMCQQEQASLGERTAQKRDIFLCSRNRGESENGSLNDWEESSIATAAVSASAEGVCGVGGERDMLKHQERGIAVVAAQAESGENPEILHQNTIAPPSSQHEGAKDLYSCKTLSCNGEKSVSMVCVSSSVSNIRSDSAQNLQHPSMRNEETQLLHVGKKVVVTPLPDEQWDRGVLVHYSEATVNNDSSSSKTRGRMVKESCSQRTQETTVVGGDRQQGHTCKKIEAGFQLDIDRSGGEVNQKSSPSSKSGNRNSGRTVTSSEEREIGLCRTTTSSSCKKTSPACDDTEAGKHVRKKTLRMSKHIQAPRVNRSKRTLDRKVVNPTRSNSAASTSATQCSSTPRQNCFQKRGGGGGGEGGVVRSASHGPSFGTHKHLRRRGQSSVSIAESGECRPTSLLPCPTRSTLFCTGVSTAAITRSQHPLHPNTQDVDAHGEKTVVSSADCRSPSHPPFVNITTSAKCVALRTDILGHEVMTKVQREDVPAEDQSYRRTTRNADTVEPQNARLAPVQQCNDTNTMHDATRYRETREVANAARNEVLVLGDAPPGDASNNKENTSMQHSAGNINNKASLPRVAINRATMASELTTHARSSSGSSNYCPEKRRSITGSSEHVLLRNPAEAAAAAAAKAAVAAAACRRRLLDLFSPVTPESSTAVGRQTPAATTDDIHQFVLVWLEGCCGRLQAIAKNSAADLAATSAADEQQPIGALCGEATVSRTRSDIDIVQALLSSKRQVKEELKAYDAAFFRRYGRVPGRPEKEPLRPLYSHYQLLRRLLLRVGKPAVADPQWETQAYPSPGASRCGGNTSGNADMIDNIGCKGNEDGTKGEISVTIQPTPPDRRTDTPNLATVRQVAAVAGSASSVSVDAGESCTVVVVSEGPHAGGSGLDRHFLIRQEQHCSPRNVAGRERAGGAAALPVIADWSPSDKATSVGSAGEEVHDRQEYRNAPISTSSDITGRRLGADAIASKVKPVFTSEAEEAVNLTKQSECEVEKLWHRNSRLRHEDRCVDAVSRRSDKNSGELPPHSAPSVATAAERSKNFVKRDTSFAPVPVAGSSSGSVVAVRGCRSSDRTVSGKTERSLADKTQVHSDVAGRSHVCKDTTYTTKESMWLEHCSNEAQVAVMRREPQQVLPNIAGQLSRDVCGFERPHAEHRPHMNIPAAKSTVNTHESHTKEHRGKEESLPANPCASPPCQYRRDDGRISQQHKQLPAVAAVPVESTREDAAEYLIAHRRQRVTQDEPAAEKDTVWERSQQIPPDQPLKSVASGVRFVEVTQPRRSTVLTPHSADVHPSEGGTRRAGLAFIASATTEYQQRLVRLQQEKRLLRTKLLAYQAEFTAETGRVVQLYKDIAPIEREYRRYKEVKQEIARLTEKQCDTLFPGSKQDAIHQVSEEDGIPSEKFGGRREVCAS